ncbi:MAG: hypothetical protein GTN80_11780 [Nitrososphaeria archaeon]|nr:hypothetical protein [Nitrososphaeria archaeon]NIQ34296.1 hypothetical protein [Nitrososphaeria archaeon]
MGRYTVALTLGVSILAPIIFIDNPFIVTLLTISLYTAVIASNWNLLFGHTGIWSLGQLGFFAIGAYASAFMSKGLIFPIAVSPWLAILTGLGISILIALGISFVTLRLKAGGFYFAIATLGFAEVVRGLIVTIWPGVVFDLPHLGVGGFSFVSNNSIGYYYLFLISCLLSIISHKYLMSSSVGRAAIALRDSEQRAISLGVKPVRIRMLMFVVSVAFTSIIGSFYAHYTNSVGQAILGFDVFLMYFIILAFGGIGTFYGPVAASFLWIFIDFFLRLYLKQLRPIIMGLMVILSLLFLKKGIVGLWEKIKPRLMSL